MRLIVRFLDKSDLNVRLQRVVVIGIPSLLLLLSQSFVSTELFKAMVTVTAIVTSFTPLARGGFFHNFKYAVISEEKIAASKAIYMLVTTIIASQCFSAALYFNGLFENEGLLPWVLYTVVSFIAFILMLMVEMYFYDFRQRRAVWPISFIVALVIILAFFVLSNNEVFYAQFTRVFSQVLGASIIVFWVFKTFKYRFTSDLDWWAFKEKSFWVGINVAIVTTLLAYTARSEVISGGADLDDILLSNCLLIFGFLKLVLYKEIRSMERFYLKSNSIILAEVLSVLMLSVLILLVAEILTFVLVDRALIFKIDLMGHFQSFLFVVSLCLVMLIGSKLLRFFERSYSFGMYFLIMVVFVFVLAIVFSEWVVIWLLVVYGASNYIFYR
ncbi:MAG: hypothetical protein K6L74_12650 [Neptuniibacter sp.]